MHRNFSIQPIDCLLGSSSKRNDDYKSSSRGGGGGGGGGASSMGNSDVSSFKRPINDGYKRSNDIEPPSRSGGSGGYDQRGIVSSMGSSTKDNRFNDPVDNRHIRYFTIIFFLDLFKRYFRKIFIQTKMFSFTEVQFLQVNHVTWIITAMVVQTIATRIVQHRHHRQHGRIQIMAHNLQLNHSEVYSQLQMMFG